MATRAMPPAREAEGLISSGLVDETGEEEGVEERYQGYWAGDLG